MVGHSLTSTLFNLMRQLLLGFGGLGLLLIFSGPATAVAQTEPLLVTLANLESNRFPEITTWVTVADNNGPVEGLTEANFELIEDNRPTAVGPLTVTAEPSQKLRVVFAVDTNTTELNLAEAKAAVISVVNKLGSGDRAGLLSFGNQVELEYKLTNNTTALQAAVGRLSPQPGKTALHQAVSEAVAMLDEFSDGRKAIVVITNGFDSLGSPPADQLFSQLQQSGRPLYVVGLGSKVQAPHPLKTEAAASGGQFIPLKAASSLPATLLELEERLRQGYRISFQSTLKADNLPHTLALNVTGPTGQGAATGRFVALPGKIVITPQGIAANQTVKGVINLAAEVLSPGPLATVSYFMDDRLLAEVSSLPYSFAWDTTTTTPGDHLLTIKAVDQAGNESQVGLNLVVAAPLQVFQSTATHQVELGQPATVQVKVESLAEVTRLDLLLDGQVLTSQTAPPYHFSLDSKQYAAGLHQVTVRAEDSQGRLAQDSLEMTFVTPPPAPPGRLESFIQSQRVQSTMLLGTAGIAIVAAALLASLGVIRLERSYRRVNRRQTRLQIINQGNIQSRYQLVGNDAQGCLNFQFALPGPAPAEPAAAASASQQQVIARNVALLKARAGVPASATGAFQTPFIAPNESLWVELLIRPHRPYQKETCPFEIVSQAIDQPHAPKIKEAGTVELSGLFWGWRYLSFLVVIAATAWLIWQILALTLWRLPTIGSGQFLSLVW